MIPAAANQPARYYAYNWFNNSAVYWGGYPGQPGQPGEPGYGGNPSGYYGFPSFSITSVVRDITANVQAYNLPPNKTFQVRMGPMGTRAIGGYMITNFNTGAGGMQSLSFPIPAPLYGLPQIAIRMQATDQSGYYAYNWFYNR